MARASTHECANCAAPLRIPQDHERFFRCEYCGTVLEDRNRDQRGGKPELARADPPAEVLVSYPVASDERPRLVGATMIIVLAVGAGALLVFSPDGPGVDGLTGTSGPPYGSLAAATLVASGDDTSPDVVAVGSTTDGAVLAYLDEEAADGVRWTAEVPDHGDGTGTAVTLVDRDRLYVATAERLSAHNREQGVQLWSVPLSDTTLLASCDCLRLVGDVVVVLSTDGSVTAHDPDDGSQRWSHQLPDSPTQLVDVNDQIGVIDQSDDGWVLRVLDPATGEVVDDAPLSCRVPGDDTTDRLGPGSRLTEVGDGAVVFFGRTSTGTCAARWDPGRDEPTWEAAVALDFLSSSSGLARGEGLQVGGTLFVGQEESLSAIDLTDGTVTVLAADDPTTFWPVALRDEILVVAAESMRGSGSWELRGIDTQTTNTRWVLDLEAAAALQFGRMTLTADDTWFAVSATDGVAVVRIDEDLAGTVQLVATGSGTSGPAEPLDLPDVVAGFVELPGAHGNDVWLGLDGRIVRFDVTDGTTTPLP